MDGLIAHQIRRAEALLERHDEVHAARLEAESSAQEARLLAQHSRRHAEEMRALAAATRRAAQQMAAEARKNRASTCWRTTAERRP